MYSCSSERYPEIDAKYAPPPSASGSSQTSNNKMEILSERKIIKEGKITFETIDIKKTKIFISKIVNELGGYIAKENIFTYSDKILEQLVIRIPANKFDQLVNTISETTKNLEEKEISVLDVTEEYIDIEARLNTKKALENRYKELLQQAKTVEEMLKIEEAIGTLREEIESMEGRIRYLKDQVQFSSLTVEYYQRISSANGFFFKLGKAIVVGWDGFLNFIIGITHIWSFILIIGGVVWGIIKLKKRRKKKQINTSN